MRKYGLLIAAVALLAGGTPTTASGGTTLVARINLSRQLMNVYVDGIHYYSWPVSTARRGYTTPVGSYRPQVLARMHYSRKYDNTPMPHSVFFRGGYAIHGTSAISRLGSRASHGCVRLHPQNAAEFYSLIKTYGSANTRIKISY